MVDAFNNDLPFDQFFAFFNQDESNFTVYVPDVDVAALHSEKEQLETPLVKVMDAFTDAPGQ